MIQIGDAKVWNKDCFEAMSTLESQSVDMVLCDLPYGTTQNKWDTVLPLDKLWAEYERLLRPTGVVVLTASQPFTSKLVVSKLDWFRYEWVWVKNKSSGHLNAKRKPMRAHEDVLVFSKFAHTYIPQMSQGHKPGNYAKRSSRSTNYGKEIMTEYGGSTLRYPKSTLEISVVNNDDPDKSHPTQKPVELMEYLIRTYTNPNDTVLDNTMGSGTTGVACLHTGRKFLGMETNEKYFQTACTRLEKLVKT
jgi:DNA modification methylase